MLILLNSQYRFSLSFPENNFYECPIILIMLLLIIFELLKKQCSKTKKKSYKKNTTKSGERINM